MVRYSRFCSASAGQFCISCACSLAERGDDGRRVCRICLCYVRFSGRGGLLCRSTQFGVFSCFGPSGVFSAKGGKRLRFRSAKCGVILG